mmetsp:Transcript_13794/g.34443  ORF Transcript_13794/g.34443 Transcript_13794/m.34443 type:complete len:216 (+) Transcript_13794:3865-4512(+)
MLSSPGRGTHSCGAPRWPSWTSPSHTRNIRSASRSLSRTSSARLWGWSGSRSCQRLRRCARHTPTTTSSNWTQSVHSSSPNSSRARDLEMEQSRCSSGQPQRSSGRQFHGPTCTCATATRADSVLRCADCGTRTSARASTCCALCAPCSIDGSAVRGSTTAACPAPTFLLCSASWASLQTLIASSANLEGTSRMTRTVRMPRMNCAVPSASSCEK